MTKKSVLFVASEGLPFIKTGGLADVIGSLPKELVKQGWTSEWYFLSIRKLLSITMLISIMYQVLMCGLATSIYGKCLQSGC